MLLRIRHGRVHTRELWWESNTGMDRFADELKLRRQNVVVQTFACTVEPVQFIAKILEGFGALLQCFQHVRDLGLSRRVDRSIEQEACDNVIYVFEHFGILHWQSYVEI